MNNTLKDNFITFLETLIENSPASFVEDLKKAVFILKKKALLPDTLVNKNEVIDFIILKIFEDHKKLINEKNLMAFENFLNQVNSQPTLKPNRHY